MPRRLLLTVALFLASTDAFVVVQQPHPRRTGALAATYDKKGHHISVNPMEGNKSVDINRARECAENFGKCSIEEMEQIKNNLHQERLQNFMFGGSAMTEPAEDGLEHRLLEEELELQLALLKEHTPDASLFPDDEEENKVLPHLKDTVAKQEDVGMFHKPTPSEILAIEETVLEENILEPLMICLVIVGLGLVPQLLHL